MYFLIKGLEPIQSLSYWRFTRLRSCFLSGAYPASVKTDFKIDQVFGRSQVIGNMFHLLMEKFHALRTQGPVTHKLLRNVFSNQMDETWGKIQETPSMRHLGDPRTWPELTPIYESICDLADRSGSSVSRSSTELKTEQILYSRDRLLVGQIDAFFVDDDGIDLIDYKSGEITTDNASIREAYVEQLLFYAYLIHENYGVYPKSLTLIGKDSDRVRVRPSQENSNALANEMRTMLARYNDQVAQALPLEKFTNPSSTNCLFCDAKPICGPFWIAASGLNLPQWAHIVVGIQTEAIQKRQGKWLSLDITIEKGSFNSSKTRITRIFSPRYPDLENIVGQRLLITYLRSAQSGMFEIMEMTERSQIVRLGGATID